ncbi:hypothetical protein ACFWXK_18735 [Streptomyces sp. NPDC059070]|uniref:hypothetical protein n=1 Tax=unclassified Streptomyces TaxID=2593676 RepID=UPI0034E278FF
MPGIDECLLETMRVPGARGAALVDWTSGLALGAVGDTPGGDHEATAAETAEFARAAAEHPSFAPGPDAEPAGAAPPVEDVLVTTGTGYHLLHFVATAFDSSVFLYLWLDRDQGNLALARRCLRDLAGQLVPA